MSRRSRGCFAVWTRDSRRRTRYTSVRHALAELVRVRGQKSHDFCYRPSEDEAGLKPVPFLRAVLGQCQDFRSGFGHEDRVLELGG